MISSVLDLIYELLWYLLIAILEDSVALKSSRVQYVTYKLVIMISAHRVYLLVQYFLICFIYVIQDTF